VDGPGWDVAWTELLRDSGDTWHNETFVLPAGEPSVWVAFWLDDGEGDFAKIDNVHVIGGAPTEPACHTNTATATGTVDVPNACGPDGESNAQTSCEARVCLSTGPAPEPAIDIRKQEEGFDKRSFPSGADVAFEIEVCNTGEVDLINVVVTDELTPDCNQLIGDLGVGECAPVYECTAPNVHADFTNEACVAGEANGVTVEDCDLSLIKITCASSC
jgi:hypothetical protein